MRVLVTMKHVPDTTEVRFGGDGSLLVRQAPTKINDYDRNALEAAAQLRERGDAEVVVACVGPAEAAKTLKEALAYGADRAVLVTTSDPVDSAAAASLLAGVALSQGPFDLVLSGDVSEDGYDGIVPGLVAALLDVALVRGVTSLRVEDASAQVTRVADELEETLRVALPAVLSVTRLINTPRTITTMQVMKVPMSKVTTMTASDVGVDASELEPSALAVRTIAVRPATQSRANEMLSGDAGDVAAQLIERLVARGVLS